MAKRLRLERSSGVNEPGSSDGCSDNVALSTGKHSTCTTYKSVWENEFSWLYPVQINLYNQSNVEALWASGSKPIGGYMWYWAKHATQADERCCHCFIHSVYLQHNQPVQTAMN